MRTLEIKKPLYSTFCYIRDIYLQDKNLRVVLPQGEAIIDCAEWIKTGKKMEKIFNRPDEPMILWGNYVKIEGLNKPEVKKEEPPKDPEPEQSKLF